MRRIDDTEAWRRLIASLAQWSRNVDGASEGMRTIERDGVVATIAPAAPERAVVNDVVYWDAAGLRSAYDEIAAAYDEAGIQAWTVWVPEAEPAVAELLAARGHVLDSDPEAMILELDGVERPPPPPGFATDVDARTIARINDAAYGLPGSFERALSGMRRDDGVHFYAAGEGDEPSSCLIAFDHDGDCSIWLVATLPQARGNGLVRGLMGHALADGRERGCTTSTLEATDLGRPVYERLGYRSLGEIQMWERRAAA